jgi:hypothetical protein
MGFLKDLRIRFSKKETAESIIDKMAPEERTVMKDLLQNLTNELMEKTQQCRMLEKELKEAVKRKKVKHDPLTGHVAMVLFTKPRVEGAKARMFTSDNVQTNQALRSIKNAILDRDNDFLGGYILREMRGKTDSFERLETNAEAAWHLYQCLDRDCKLNDPEASMVCQNCEGDPNGFKEETGHHCVSCGGMGRVMINKKKEKNENDSKKGS